MPVLVFGKVEYVFNDIHKFIFCSAFVVCKDLNIDLGFNYVKDDLVNFLNLQGNATGLTNKLNAKLTNQLRKAFHPDKLKIFKELRDGGLVFNRLMTNQFISEFVANRMQSYIGLHSPQNRDFIISNTIALCFNTLVNERKDGKRDDILNNFFSEFYAPEKHDELAEFVGMLYDPSNIKYLTSRILNKIKKENDFIFEDIELDEKYLNDGKDFCSLISYLENQKNSQAYLCCALLLNNQIPCYNEDMDGDNNYAEQEYFIKRYSDAISFYLLAAKDPELLPIVRTMLSFMRADMETSKLSDRGNLFFNHLKRVCLSLEARPVLLSGYELFRDTSRIDAPMHLMKKTLQDKSIYVSKDLLEDWAIFDRLKHRNSYRP